MPIIEAFEKADKAFDLVYFPNGTHAFGDDPYFQRRVLSYFVEHLLGAAPPTARSR